MQDLVDRKNELSELRQLADRDQPAMALLYGRRRVGKTFLLDRVWDDERYFYFLATDTTAELNRTDLLTELDRWCDREIHADDHPTWRLVFRLLTELADQQALVVVLDEFQYLTGTEEDITSQLVAIWDREARDVPLTLVLCGSEVGTMRDLGRGDAPLYGRFDWAARLRGFDYFDTAQMVPDYSRRQAILTHAIFGGTPSYLSAVDSSISLSDNVARTLLSPRGQVHLQLEHLIEQEHGIRKPADYRAVLRAVAEGNREVNDIRQAAGLADRPHAVRRVLDVLTDLELVRKEANFDAGKTSPRRYVVDDCAVRFWYRFVVPSASRLARLDPMEVWRARVEPHLNTYAGKVFEDVCRDAYDRIHRQIGLGFVQRWTRWEGRDRNRRSIEIDIVAELQDGELLTGEIKWSSNPVGRSIHRDLQRDLEDLGNSGRGWARDALAAEESAGHIYFSAAGFTDDFTELATDDERIRLVTLDDMFEHVSA